MPKKKKVKNTDTVDAEEIEEPGVSVDLEKVTTTMLFDKKTLSEFRVRSAEEGRSMASLMRGFVDNYLEGDEEARERVEDYFPEILEGCGGLFGGFKLDVFFAKMSDAEISLADLNASEWRSVLVKLEDSGLNGATSASEYRDKFSDLNPSRKQKKDLRKLARKLIKQKKDEW